MPIPPLAALLRRAAFAAACTTTMVACTTTRECREDSCEACENNRPHAAVCKNPTIHNLATDLDHLERKIDEYGSVVAKVPDVWGQARLTKYREEFEKEMAAEVNKFAIGYQGAVARSDQSYLTNSLAISAAISSRQAGLFAPRPRVAVQNNTTNLEKPTAVLAAPAAGTGPTNLDDAFNATNFVRTGVKMGAMPNFEAGNLKLEQTEYLAQKSRYLNYLSQLRRNNEGDDTADSPGYSLNLVRIPVSVLPGKHTDRAYGAEVTFTLTPHLGDELLPVTFRQLVINDLVDLLAAPVAQMAFQNSGEIEKIIVSRNPAITRSINKLNSDLLALEKELESIRPGAGVLAKPGTRADGDAVDKYVAKSILSLDSAGQKTMTARIWEKMKGDETQDKKRQLQTNLAAIDTSKNATANVQNAVAKATISITSGSAGARSRVANHAVPPSQFLDAIGTGGFAEVAISIAKQTGGRLTASKEHYYIDIERALQEEINAGYRLLAPGGHPKLWEFAGPNYQLANWIRTHQVKKVEDLRLCFYQHCAADPTKPTVEELNEPAVKVALAWAIIVESALLSEKLGQDMVEAASQHNCPCLQHAINLPFFDPNPPAEAREAFKQYVKCRWPIHVFALDPENQEQNVQDSFSMRREMQLALSMAFVSGQINANNMTRYARRLETDVQAIALNRTQVGFSHGEDTFGWRFYPRFQTPDVVSNATALVRDNLIGGPNKADLMRMHRLEPGIRECVALVIMPSFVPTMHIESSGNWFKLTNPKHKEFQLTDAMKMSKLVKSVQNCNGSITDANCYRDGDLARLMAKAKQLEARLPLQDIRVQVPNENTLGGFEMFSNGVTDLAPELRGWYGAPGISTAKDTSTTIFLIGNHYSVNMTRVVAGGKPIDNFQMLSRQIMRITVPANVSTYSKPVTSGGNPQFAADGSPKMQSYVDIHVATPYGVSAAIQVPVVEVAAAPDKKGAAAWASAGTEVAFIYSGLGIAPSADPKSRPNLTVSWGDGLGTFPIGVSGTIAMTPVGADAPVTAFAIDPDDFKADPTSPDKGTINVKSAAFLGALFKSFETTFGPEQTNSPYAIHFAANLTVAGKKIPLEKPLSVNWVKAPK